MITQGYGGAAWVGVLLTALALVALAVPARGEDPEPGGAEPKSSPPTPKPAPPDIRPALPGAAPAPDPAPEPASDPAPESAPEPDAEPDPQPDGEPEGTPAPAVDHGLEARRLAVEMAEAAASAQLVRVEALRAEAQKLAAEARKDREYADRVCATAGGPHEARVLTPAPEGLQQVIAATRKMSPRAAAPIVMAWTPRLAVDVLQALPSRTVAPILAAMPADKAAELSTRMALTQPRPKAAAKEEAR